MKLLDFLKDGYQSPTAVRGALGDYTREDAKLAVEALMRTGRIKIGWEYCVSLR